MPNIVENAMKYLGVPYVWGGESASGFDCSGLVQKVYSESGLTVPRVAQDQYNAANKISKENLKPGDLIFKGGSENNITHVMIYAGNGNVIHAPRTGDVVKVQPLNEFNQNNLYYGSFGAGDSNYSFSGASPGVTVNNGSSTAAEWSDSFLGKLVKFIAIVALVVLAALFFMKAFNIEII